MPLADFYLPEPREDSDIACLRSQSLGLAGLGSNFTHCNCVTLGKLIKLNFLLYKRVNNHMYFIGLQCDNAEVSNLLASLGHTGRRVVSGHTLNTL